MKKAKDLIMDKVRDMRPEYGSPEYRWHNVLIYSVNESSEMGEEQEAVLEDILRDYQGYDVLAVATWVNSCG